MATATTAAARRRRRHQTRHTNAIITMMMESVDGAVREGAGGVESRTPAGTVSIGGGDTDMADTSAATGRLMLKGPVVDLLTPFTMEGDVDFVALGAYLQVLV